MNTIYKKIFVTTFFVLLSLPMTYCLGIKDNTVIAGAEVLTDLPSLQKTSFYNRNFQPLFESWWNSHFGFRGFMLKTKNQIYDWSNLSRIHSGSFGVVVEGVDEYLFTNVYFGSFYKNCSFIPKEIYRLKELQNLLKKYGIDVFVILAPNKAVTYPDLIPYRYKYFLGTDCGYYQTLYKTLQSNGIKTFDAQQLISNIRKNGQYQPFSVTGTHWNYYSAGMTFLEAAKKFNWGNIEIEKIDKQVTPFFTERDIADLLNLWYTYYPKQMFYKPIFKKTKASLSGNTTIIGNSFSNEFLHMFIESGLTNGEIYHFENQPLNDKDIDKILNSRRIIFVYTDIALINQEDQFYKKIDVLLNKLKHQE